MPLLVCPNDSTSMQTAHRSGVEFDMCPTCRGVWLDRGELEKLMAVDREASGPPESMEPPRRAGLRQQEHRPYERGRDWDDDDDRRYGKKRRSSIFDIFD